MTEDEIVTLGNYCEGLLQNHLFTKVLSEFERQLFDHMMRTEAHEQKKREGIYATCRGVQDLLGHMHAIVTERDKIEEQNKAKTAPSEWDAQVLTDKDFD